MDGWLPSGHGTPVTVVQPAGEFWLACTKDDTVKVQKFVNKHEVDPNRAQLCNHNTGFSPLSTAAQYGLASIC